MNLEPRYFHPTHTHGCPEPHCTARVGCAAKPERDDDGARHCPLEAEPDQFLCEDHRHLPACDWCGEREGEPLVEYDGDRMHPTCAQEAVAW